jgi:hypothetical protein
MDPDDLAAPTASVGRISHVRIDRGIRKDSAVF